MLDPRLLRTELDGVRANLARRGFTLDAKAFQSLEERRKAVQVRVEEVTDRRATLCTLAGHPLAGAVRFLAEERADNIRPDRRELGAAGNPAPNSIRRRLVRG